MAQIDNYLSARKTLIDDDKNPHLLAGRKNMSVKDYDVRKAFHQAVKDIGASGRKQTIGDMTFSAPVPHSLRHSFAVNTLKRAKERGICPQKVLPILAAYMGHCKYQYTVAYLKVLDSDQRAGMLAFAKSRK